MDVQLIDGNRVRFRKKLWHESETLLADCFYFDTSNHLDNGVIVADLLYTSKRSVYEFIKLAFKNFSESPLEEDRRNEFYCEVDKFYEGRDRHVDSILKTRLPYYDKFYTHQKDTIFESYNRKYNFLALEMGLGKTCIAGSLARVRQQKRTVIFCPSAVKWNWYRDLTETFGFNELYFTILDAAKRRTMIALTERFVIVNYDIAGKFHDYLAGGGIDGFVLDEGHLLKNHNSQRYRNIKALVDKYPDAPITFLSGSPIKNRVNDVFAYFKLIGHPLGSSYKKFLDQYTIKTNSRGGERVTGGKNLHDLYVKLSNFMIRKTKKECLDLPDKIYFNYRYELDDYRDEYNKIIEELSKNKDVRALSGNLHSLNIITSKAKIPGVIEIAEEILESGKKVVIFGSYKEPLSMLEAHFKNQCVKVDGSVDSWSRDQNIRRFVNDPECTVFLGNMIAAGVGINLVNSSDIIFLNFPFTPSELHQSIDRLHRIGQKNSVNVHYTFCDDSIDNYIYDIIIDKQIDINILIDEGKEVLFKENFIEILIKKLLNKDDGNSISESQHLPVVTEEKVEKIIQPLSDREKELNKNLTPGTVFNQDFPDPPSFD